MQAILITGISGSGKTTLWQHLSSEGFEAHDLEAIPGMFKRVDEDGAAIDTLKGGSSMDTVSRGEWICDLTELDQLIAQQRQPTAYYFGYAGNQPQLVNRFDHRFVLSVSPIELRRRLELRPPGSYGDTEEVRDYTVGGIGWYEVHMKQQGATVINAELPVQDVIQQILRLSAT